MSGILRQSSRDSEKNDAEVVHDAETVADAARSVSDKCRALEKRAAAADEASAENEQLKRRIAELEKLLGMAPSNRQYEQSVPPPFLLKEPATFPFSSASSVESLGFVLVQEADALQRHVHFGRAEIVRAVGSSFGVGSSIGVGNVYRLGTALP